MQLAEAHAHSAAVHRRFVSQRRSAASRLRRQTVAKASIVGGELAQAGQFPSLAYVANFKGEEVGLCTGTVIAPTLVLTAAHCAENLETGAVEAPSGYRVVTGTVNWASAERTVLTVSKVIVFPRFDREAMTGDAALLELSSPTSASPIRLASASDGALTAAGTPAVLAGWGDTYSGQQAPTESLRFAETVIQGSPWCERNAAPFDHSSQLCAVDPPSFQTGPCEGDSGGPLIVNDPAAGGMVEVGITSQGPVGCSTTQPSIFTRASAISSWAQGWVQALGGGAPAATVKPSQPPPPPPAGSGSPPAGTGSPPGVHAQAPGGLYRGRTSQRGGSIGLVIGSGGRRLTAIATSILYRCRSGRSVSAPLEGLSADKSAAIGAGRRFSFSFAAGRAIVRIKGSLNTVAGTLKGTIRSTWPSARYGRCTASNVRWSATRQPEPSATVALAPHGGYRGPTASHGSIALRIDSSGRKLTGISFSALYHCRSHHHTLRLTDQALSSVQAEALASVGTFTLRLAGRHQHGRIDGTFSLIPNVAFGTLTASVSTRRWGMCSTGLLTWRAVLR